MIQKIQERLNEEIAKIIAKEDLTHADYYFLDKTLQTLKSEQNQNEFNKIFLDGLGKIADTFSYKDYKNV